MPANPGASAPNVVPSSQQCELAFPPRARASGRDWLIPTRQGADVEQPDAVRQAVTALSRFFVGEGSLPDTLRRVAELACEAIGPADMAGITMLVDGRPCTAVFTDAESPEMDAAQYRAGSGPCLDAFRDKEVYRITSTRTDARWPAFAEAAVAHGVVSTISLPLIAQQHAVGALNLYARDRAFSEDDEQLAGVFSAQAAIAVANAQSYWDARQLGENLTQAMLSRAVIEQAKGILMGAGGLDADEAFTTLVDASQRENRKVRDIAAQIVTRARARGAAWGPG